MKEKKKPQQNAMVVRYYYDKEFNEPLHNVCSKWFNNLRLDEQVWVESANITYFLRQANDAYDNMCL